MTPPHKMIASLPFHSKADVLLVRATRIWESINTKTGKLIHTNVIFVDEEDSHVLAIIYNNQKDTYFPDKIKEGLVYTISDFIVTTGPKEYRAVDRDLALNFYHKTGVVQTEDTAAIPRYKFQLTELEKVPTFVSKVKNFIDVVGMVEIYADAGQSSKGDKKLEVRIINQRKAPMMITLWQAKATQFLNELEKANGSAAFVVITGLLPKKIADDIVLSSRDSTQTYCNIDCAPLNALRDEILSATGQTLADLPPPKKSGFMTATPITLDEVTIQHILDTETPVGKEVILFLCRATITDVSNYDGWFYNSCPKCPRGVELQGDKYYCVSCPGPADTVKQRYRVRVMVEDDSGKTSFTLFRNQVEQLIGVPIEKVVNEIGQDKITDEIPPVIKNMIGKLCLFELKVNSYNKPGRDGYTVTRLSEPPTVTPPSTSQASEDGAPSKKQRVD